MIDDKLKEILKDCIPGDHAVYFEAYDEALAQIKQALIDAGYIDYNNKVYTQDSFGEGKAYKLTTVKMTGQEWLDRFSKYLKENLASFVSFEDIDMNIYDSGKEAAVTAALEAATRAAGLK